MPVRELLLQWLIQYGMSWVPSHELSKYAGSIKMADAFRMAISREWIESKRGLGLGVQYRLSESALNYMNTETHAKTNVSAFTTKGE